MTDKKEIIVHGVDVSECEKLAPYNGYDEETKCNPSCCQNSPNCKFKQLKRKERECEELKEKLIRISGEYKDTLSIVEDMAIFLGLERIDHFNIYQCYYKLKEMLNEYRQELEPFKDNYFKNLDTKTIAELAKKSIRLTTENGKFEDALDEIEENIKAMNNECFYDDICECNNCDMKNGCTYYRKFNILNIINKAKGGVNGNT
nr:MAG TPA: hypothetical protein [Caudoviricetes sp.]